MTEQTVVLGAPPRHVPAHGQRADAPHGKQPPCNTGINGVQPGTFATPARPHADPHYTPKPKVNPFAGNTAPRRLATDARTGVHGTATGHVTTVRFFTDNGLPVVALLFKESGRYSNFREDETNRYLLDALEDAGLKRDGDIHHVNWTVKWALVDTRPQVLDAITFNQSEEPMSNQPAPDDAPARTNVEEFARAHAAAETKPSATPGLDAVFGPKDGAAKQKVFTQYFPWLGDVLDDRHINDDQMDTIRDAVARKLTNGKSESFKDLPDGITLAQLQKATFEILAVSSVLNAPEAAHGVETAAPAIDVPAAPETPASGEIARVETRKPDPLPRQEKPVVNNDGVIDLKAQIRERYNKPQRGNDYLVVQGRVLLFRLEHPDWTVETDAVLMTDTAAVFKATIRNPEGRIISTGHGKATEAGTKNLSGRYIEKAETSAIGRALALAGFGTDDSLDDSDYLADSPVEKKAS